MLANSYFLLFAALFDLHLHLIINVLSRAIPRERLRRLNQKCRFLEEVTKLWFNQFLSDFAEIRRLTLNHMLLRVGCLGQAAKIGERVKKRSARVLKFSL
jgi:hypothetical protein